MAVIEGAASGALMEVGAAPSRGGHVISKPQDHGTLGHYSYAGATLVIGAGATANSEVFQLRWGDATRFCVVHEISITGMRTAVAFAAGNIDLRATIARAWTVSGTGGTPVTLTGENNQLRTAMGASLVADMRIASTAALGVGTKTLDAQDIGMIVSHSSAGPQAATPIIGQVFLPTGVLFKADIASGEHPIVLAQNEGVVIRATVPATGTWNLGVLVKWSELTAF